MDKETQFLMGMMDLDAGLKERTTIITLKKIAKYISWAKGWPNNDCAFWNAEAFRWKYKIDLEIRDLILKELKLKIGTKIKPNFILDLGCGAYSYFPCVGLDFSQKMLNFNQNINKKILADLEHKLPVIDKSFQIVTAIFVLNYVHNLGVLFNEVNRILKNEGKFLIVLSGISIKNRYLNKEINHYSFEDWKKTLERYFKVNSKVKRGIIFFECQKKCNCRKDY